MKESPYILEEFEEKNSLHLKEELLKYLRYWPWFLGTVILTVVAAFFYLKYASVTYTSVAKIKIVDESKEMNIATDAMSLLSGKPQINLENEIEVLKSYRLLKQVVAELQLDVAYYIEGNIKTAEVWDTPFVITKQIPQESFKTSKSYTITMSSTDFTITDEGGKTYKSSFENTDGAVDSLPFNIAPKENATNYEGITFKVVLVPLKQAVMGLRGQLQANATNKNSDILSLSMVGESKERSEAILNTIIDKFNQDGILDRQLVSKRTLDFIDDRFIFLTQELDSIEGDKKSFKQENNLSYIEADAGITLKKKSTAEEESFRLETQIALSKLLQQTLAQEAAYSLLPADIGLENSGINSLVSDYNQLVLERDKLVASAGENNPTLLVINSQLQRTKQNILQTVGSYQQQLQVSRAQLRQEERLAGASFSQLPEKEQLLRAIERQQSIKENLFLLLLQKREEAAISLAVTAPSIKVVDYALTSNIPVSPKKKQIMAMALLLGLLLPFGVLYLRFTLDTKIHERADLEKENPEIPVLAEIPFLEDHKTFVEANDRSILAESFRILSTNVDYLLPKKDNGEGQVIYVSSTIKGEGKTLVALNLSLAYASIHKKVLLIGADMRNPQLHNYFEVDKNVQGLADYLYDPELNWKDSIHEGYNKIPYHKVCFSGSIPPNAPQLLSGGGFEKFINAAKQEFDYIIVDTAPTILITDTLLISQHADATLYVTRAGYTDKRLLEFSKELNKSKKLKNMGYLLNEVGLNRSKGYGYGYNYGYGYGYSEDGAKHTPWYKRWGKRS
ncbi:polysaccharide biosynthesis tyrosine autokinase [Arenibacter aquaticus]|uniref:Polysaccharide biosynthesis tyrosine autokinase n=1 Tax=Arenibacter aquaticus TaxID=2489054 RepID=A0A3S0CHV3_9FLAO|nr:tyrosine-protein kinase domain-containing protein [Arenibacter aquaticus]RTE51712.1 polysaccharide biosynthesis tyrosine autokinase [Arenibacter aquaticus]